MLYSTFMKIPYIPEHAWYKPVVEDPLSLMGKSSQAQLRSTLRHDDLSRITYSIEPLSDDILQWFTPLYTQEISNRANPKVSDIYGTTLGKESPYTYYALLLYENRQRIGATIFSERKTMLSIAYRIYPHKWSSVTLQANPSLYTEYLINTYAYERGLPKLSHGRDRNPYGVNSYIGLAAFKLSIGCTALIPASAQEILTFDTDAATCDTLILQCPPEGRQVKQAYLICTEDTKEKYTQATKYPHLLPVETIIRQSGD